jgi:hypothetical protein
MQLYDCGGRYDCGGGEVSTIFFLLHPPVRIDVNRQVHVFTKYLSKNWRWLSLSITQITYYFLLCLS